MLFLSACLSDLAKYVFNACLFESECSECCKIHFETNEIEVSSSDDSEVEVLIMDCCLFHHKNK